MIFNVLKTEDKKINNVGKSFGRIQICFQNSYRIIRLIGKLEIEKSKFLSFA